MQNAVYHIVNNKKYVLVDSEFRTASTIVNIVFVEQK